MAVRTVTYFDRPGAQNTDELVALVRARCEELKVGHVVVASNAGGTAIKFARALKGLPVQVVAVTGHAGFDGGDKVNVTPEVRAQLDEAGVALVMCSHALSGVARSVSNKFGTVSHVEIVAHTLRRFGTEGVKVAVEVAIMAADAGQVPTDREIIAVGGTHEGADTALVLRAAHQGNLFDNLEIREIIAKPRQRE